MGVWNWNGCGGRNSRLSSEQLAPRGSQAAARVAELGRSGADCVVGHVNFTFRNFGSVVKITRFTGGRLMNFERAVRISSSVISAIVFLRGRLICLEFKINEQSFRASKNSSGGLAGVCCVDCVVVSVRDRVRV